LDQLKLLADAMNKIKSMIQQAKTMQDSVKQHVDWYNTRVEILNKAKKECGFDYKDLVAIDMKDLENLITCDPTKLPKIDLEKEEK
jgi:aconitase B